MVFYLLISFLNLSHLKMLISSDSFKCSMACGFCFRANLKIYLVRSIDSLLRGRDSEDITFVQLLQQSQTNRNAAQFGIISILFLLSAFIFLLLCRLVNWLQKYCTVKENENAARLQFNPSMHRRFSFERKQNSTLRKLFKKIDSDSNGFISRSELRQYLEECCFFRDKEDATNSILENCDVNQDGYIDFDEFRHIIHTVQKQREDPPSNEELQGVFELFDADGNHLISFKEFWRQVRLLDASITKKEAEAMFNDIDEDSDRYIDFGEFIRYLNFPH